MRIKLDLRLSNKRLRMIKKPMTDLHVRILTKRPLGNINILRVSLPEESLKTLKLLIAIADEA